MDVFRSCCVWMCKPNWKETSKDDLKWSIMSMIECFSYRMRENQWNNLEKCISDVSIEMMLTKLLMDIIRALSKECLNCLVRTGNLKPFTESQFLDEMLTQSFKDILQVEDNVESTSSKCLNDMILTEVLRNARSFYENEKHTFHLEHIVPHEQLKMMVTFACIMLWEFTAKMKQTSIFRVRRKRMALNKELVPVNQDGVEKSKAPDYVPSSCQTRSERAQSIEAFILRELNEKMDPLLDDTPKRHFHSFFRAQVPWDVCEKLYEMLETGVFQCANLEKFYTGCFIETWLNHILDQIQENFRKDEEYSPILMGDIQPFVSDLVKWANNERKHETHDYVLETCAMATRLKEDLSKRIQMTQLDVVEENKMDEEILEEVYIFMNMLNLFNNDQGLRMVDEIISKALALKIISSTSNDEATNSQSSEVPLKELCSPQLLVDHQSSVPPNSPVQSAQDNTGQERKKRYIESIIENLVWELACNFNTESCTSQLRVIIQCLVGKILSEVKELDFHVKLKSHKNLDEKIYRKLYKMKGGRADILLCLILGDVEVEDCIISIIKDHMRHSKRTCVCKFFSRVGRAFRVFRRGKNRINPMPDTVCETVVEQSVRSL